MDKNVFDVILNMLASGIEASIQTTDITMNMINPPEAGKGLIPRPLGRL